MNDKMSHATAQVIGTRLQVVAQSITVLKIEPSETNRIWLEVDARENLRKVREFMTDHLEHLSEWQVSAFHDQHNTLLMSLNQTVNPLTPTEN